MPFKAPKAVQKKPSSHQSSRNAQSSAPQRHRGAVIQRSRRDSQSLTRQEVLHLQHTMGNRAVGRMLTQASQSAGAAGSRPVAQRKQAPCTDCPPVQRMEEEEEMPMQRMEEEEEMPMQRMEEEEEQPMQRMEKEEEQPLQGHFIASQRPVQRQGDGGAAANPTGMPGRLKAGLEELSGKDLSGVRVHHNSSKPAQVNALAYTQGRDIHVAPGQEKHLAHEGWHAVQQMQGRVKPTVQAKGVTINDDAGLEREADVMGAKALAVGRAGHTKTGKKGGTSRTSPVQREPDGTVAQRVKSHYGEFKTPRYDTITRSGRDVGVDMKLEFHPDTNKVDATKIGLTQTIHRTLGGVATPIDPTKAEHTVKSGTGEGRSIDRVSTHGNPLYAADKPGARDKLEDTPTVASWGQHGWHYFDTTGAEKTQEAILIDKPTIHGRGKNSGQVFETAALAVEGTQKGTYMGSVEWGWQVDGIGTFSKKPFTLKSNDIPTKGFMAAAEQWNKSKTRGTIKTIADPTDVYKWSGGFVKDYTVAKDTEVDIKGSSSHDNKSYNKVEIKDGTHASEIGYILVSDMKDTGGGSDTIDLPVQWAGTVTVPPKKGTLGTLRAGKGKSTDILADLPVGTRVKVMDDSSAWLFVEVDTSQAGVILNAKSKKKLDAAKMLRGYISKELVKK